MTELHARLGPSNKRWPHCPGSPREEANYPDIPGAAAVDGTGSHLLLEYCLQHGVPASSYDGHIIGVNHKDNPNGWLIHGERIGRVQECLDYVDRRCKELREDWGANHEITVQAESKSDPGGMFGRTDWWGTTDVTITVQAGDCCRFIEVIDYKDGREYVDVKKNTQLLSYLGGKLRPHIASGPELVRPFNPDKVDGARVTIVQPKTNPSVRYEDLSPTEVIPVVEELAWAAHLTDAPDAPLVPGDHCKWCKANPKRGGHCTAQLNESMEVLTTMGDVSFIEPQEDQPVFELLMNNFNDVEALDNEKLSQLADTKDALLAIYERVNTEIIRRLDTGEDVPGYAMLPGNGKNVWNADEEEIVKALKSRRLKKDQIYPPKLISPAAVMKLSDLTKTQKDKIWKEMVTKIAGDKTLKKVSRDKEKDVAQLFADVSQCTLSSDDSVSFI